MMSSKVGVAKESDANVVGFYSSNDSVFKCVRESARQ